MDWYQQVFVETGRSAALWALVGFLVTFAITRGITRRIRAKKNEPADDADGGGFSDIYIGGVHIHHQVWGILLVLLSGLLEFRFSPDAPWREVLAALFGVGAALTLDEFALWFHLDDVYWGEEGRKSIDAILIGGALGAVLLMEASPVGSTQEEGVDTWLYAVLVAFHLATAGVSFVKGKLATGLIGIVVPIVALVGAIRLAKPTSAWARRRYSEKKMNRSHQRFDDDYSRRRERLRDLVGGTVQTQDDQPGDAEADASRPATARRWAGSTSARTGATGRCRVTSAIAAPERASIGRSPRVPATNYSDLIQPRGRSAVSTAPAAAPIPSVKIPAGTTAGAAVREAGLPTTGPQAIVVVRDAHGRLRDLAWAPDEATEVEPVPADTEDGRSVIRHSAAHVLAQAVQQAFPDAKLGIGPPIKDGFYYDFDVARPFTPEDLADLDKRMRKIIKSGQRFSRRVVDSVDDAKAELADEPYKLELVDLKSGTATTPTPRRASRSAPAS